MSVQRKDGSTSEVVLERAIDWDGPEVLWTIRPSARPVTAATQRSSRDYPGKLCPQCGSEPLDDALNCWECGYQG